MLDAPVQAVLDHGFLAHDLGLLQDQVTPDPAADPSEHLTTAGIKPSTGTVGSSLDNALAETVIGLYKTELTKPRQPWKRLDDIEITTAE